MQPGQFAKEVIQVLSDLGMLRNDTSPSIVEEFNRKLEILLRMEKLRLPRQPRPQSPPPPYLE